MNEKLTNADIFSVSKGWDVNPARSLSLASSAYLDPMGLGVERDDMRAFEWYLRSAMKGHPGAQSGVGWYYEVGRGMPAPDLVRAYMWYVLSAIGGDPDAAISQEEVVKKMTSQQIEKAHVLIDDYKVWLYPFR